MAKNIEDIIPPDRRRSIRDIPIPSNRRRSDMARPAPARASSKRLAEPKHVDVHVAEEELAEARPRQNPDFPRRRRGSKRRLWISAVGAMLILSLGLLSLFDGATFAYTPKSAALIFNNETYTAHKTGTSGLFYSVVKLSRDKGATAAAGGEEEVSRKASGTIVVYNDASTESQRLIENTRFEAPDGKIYRIQTAISIPGKKTVSGVSQPGSIEATVYADQPGAEYNIGLSDFTVPGLKGTPRYSTIYARSKTPMTGGFVGKEKAVKAEDLAKAKTMLEEALKEELWQEVQAEVPADFVLFPLLSSFSFEDLPQASGGNGSVTVNRRGHLYGVMFKKSDLSSYLAEKKLGVASGEPVEIPSFDSLNVSFAGAPPADLLPLTQISFKIGGSAVLLWRTDEVALKSDIAGRHKGDIAGILKNYPTIASANITVRPFWKSVLPAEGEKISVKRVSAAQ